MKKCCRSLSKEERKTFLQKLLRLDLYHELHEVANEKNLYDVIVCNTYESIQVALTMGLEDCIQVIAYTHLESQIFKDTKNPFLHSTNDMMRKQLECNGLWIGTQSKFNQISMSNGAWYLPIPITERGLLEEYKGEREGVLFVGRWEEGGVS